MNKCKIIALVFIISCIVGTVAYAESGSLAELEDMPYFSLNDGGMNYDPVMTSDSRGTVWACWLNNGLDSDELVIRQFDTKTNKWMKPVRVTDKPGNYESPAITALSDKLLITWIENENDKWLIKYSVYSAVNKKFSAPVAGPVTKGKPHNLRITGDFKNNAWLVWESYGKLQSNVYAASYKTNKWSESIPITEGTARCYNPTVAVNSSGSLNKSVWVAYTKFENGYSDVWLAQIDPATAKPVVTSTFRVTDSGLAEYQSVIVDNSGKVWLSWEVKEKADRPYYGKKKICVAYYSDGKFFVPCSTAGVMNVPVFDDGNNQRSRLIPIDGNRVLVLSRCSQVACRSWNTRAVIIDNEKNLVSNPVYLLGKSTLGRIGDCSAVYINGNIELAWQADDVLVVPVENVKSSICETGIILDELIDNAVWRDVTWKQTEPANPVFPVIGRLGAPDGTGAQRETVKSGVEQYNVYWGNLHEHTDISTCWMDNSDGIMDDNYRYGIEVEAYDFVCLTDHDFNMNKTTWRKYKKQTAFYDEPGWFVTFPGYEWTASISVSNTTSGDGHRNVIFGSEQAAGDMTYNCQRPDYDHIAKVWDLLRGRDVITIPHHPADIGHPVDYYKDDELQPLVEIYQGRGSAEYEGAPAGSLKQNTTDRKGVFVQDALARGFHLGFIASGDHNTMGIGLACVLAKSLSREDIMSAMKQRRCYATTGDKIFMDFRVNDNLMGSQMQFAKGDKIKIYLNVRGTAPIKEIVVFKNNTVFYKQTEKKSGKKQSVELTIPDDNTSPLANYYYARVVQSNNQVAWSSPVWLTKK
jgi:hypothetical protein